MASPLTQDVRPSFQPKIVSLYDSLFKDDGTADEKSDGFWTEFFLLKPHPSSLRAVLEPLSPDDLLHLHAVTRQIFTRSVAAFKAAKSPQDEIALDTLEVFLRAVLGKRYTNPSSDVIAVLTGLDSVDAVFTDFVAATDNCIKGGRSLEIRRKAVRVALCIGCGAFNTGLLSYFHHRDLFPGIMKFINDPAAEDIAYEPFVLLGILANYNKFEMQNPYQLRLDDFVNESAIQRIVHEIGMTSIRCRTDYVALHDDLPEGWSLNSMLSYVGLTILAGAGPKPKPPSAPNGDLSKLSFTTLPNPRAAILLATYDFVKANKLFCHNFVSYNEKDPKVEPPICAYLSFTSYLLHHAHRSSRCSQYARTNLLAIRILLEDQTLCKKLASDETKGFVRLCRQKPPHLPMVRGKRVLLTAIIDTIADGINHNLRKKLDVDLYSAQITVLSRAVSHLIRTRTRLVYHWSSLWRSILTLFRFLTTYAADLKHLSNLTPLLNSITAFIATSLQYGDSFLPSAADSDDLFYKLVEAGPVLSKFRDSYALTSPSNPIATLISVADHYQALIEENGKKNLSPDMVQDVIRKGYETLELGDSGAEQKGREEAYRESAERGFLKKVARTATEDLDEVWDPEGGMGVAWESGL